GDITHVSLYDGCNIVTGPIATARMIRAPEHLRIATAQYTLHELRASADLGWLRQRPLEQAVDKAAAGASDLRLGQRQQSHDLHATCQAIGNRGQREQIG